jgi:hypothetical protein
LVACGRDPRPDEQAGSAWTTNRSGYLDGLRHLVILHFDERKADDADERGIVQLM